MKKNISIILFILLSNILCTQINAINLTENIENQKVRTFELIYKAIVEGDEINKGELISISEVNENSEKDDLIEYINSLLFIENANQLGTVIELNDSISFKTSAEGLINNIYIYYPNKKLKVSINMSYDNLSRLKLCTIRDVDSEVVDAISYTYDNYGRLSIKISNRTGGDMYQERYAYKNDNKWYVKVLFKEYHPLLYFERKSYVE